MKKTINIAVLVLLALFIFKTGAQGQCNSSWLYTRTVTVSNTTSSVLGTNASAPTFQVKVLLNTAALVGAGKMNADGSDIRFADLSCNNLNYWIENGTMNTSATVLWVKTNNIPANGTQTIRLYYGNSGAAAASSGTNTFDLFDDFLGTTLGSMWTEAGPGTSAWSLSNTGTGALTMTTTASTGDAIILYNSSFSGAITLESNITAINTSATGGGFPSIAIVNSGNTNGYILGDNTGTGTMTLGEGSGNCNSYQSSAISCSGCTVSNSSPGTLTGIWGIQWPSTSVQAAYWPGGSFSATDGNKTISSTVSVALGGMCPSGNGTMDMTIDWVRVRQYASAEPGTTNGAEESNIIAVTTLSGSYCSGASVSVPYVINGTFNPGNVFTAQISDAAGSFASPTSIGNVSSTSSGSISATFPTIGTIGTNYLVRVISSSPAYNGVSSVPLTINPLPAALAGANASMCAGGTSGIGQPGDPGATYSWVSSPVGFTSTASKSSVNPSVTTTYTVTETLAGCSNSNSVTITVNALPAAAIISPTTTLAGSPLSLGATAVAGSTYIWTSSPAGFTSTLANPTDYPVDNINYYIQETNTNGCVNNNTVYITVTPLNPVITYSATKICVGATKTLTATTNPGGSKTYQWYLSTDAGNTYNAISGATSATYNCTVTAASQFFNVTVYNGPASASSSAISISGGWALPLAKAGNPTSMTLGSSATIGGTKVTGSTYAWSSNPNGFSYTGWTTTVSPSVTTVYTVTETNSHSCVASNNVTVTITNPLPVTLISFQATLNQNKVNLDWHTASEINNSHFLVERTTDGNTWETIGKVPGHGNSVVINNYTATDNLTDLGNYPAVYYRLKQVDFNGNFDYSMIRSVNIENTLGSVKLYPNPTHDILNVSWQNNSDKASVIKIINMNGVTVLSTIVQGQGILSQSINIAALPAGTYFVQILNDQYSTTKTIIKE